MDHGEVLTFLHIYRTLERERERERERDDMVNERCMFFTRKQPSLSIELMALRSGFSLRSPNLVEPAANLHRKTTR
jgi:hypothetical protein